MHSCKYRYIVKSKKKAGASAAADGAELHTYEWAENATDEFGGRHEGIKSFIDDVSFG